MSDVVAKLEAEIRFLRRQADRLRHQRKTRQAGAVEAAILRANRELIKARKR